MSSQDRSSLPGPEARRSEGYAEAEPARQIIPAREDTGACALSFAQQRLWLIDQIEPGLSLYNIGMAYRIRGDLDATKLQGALTAVVTRHEVLRTTFPSRDGVPFQVGNPPVEVPLPRRSVTGATTEARDEEARRIAAEETRRPFRLDSDPMLRALLIEVQEREYLLVLTIHHIAGDAWSNGILAREISEYYAAAIEHRPPRLKPLPIQYADYALWQRGWLQGERLDRELAYWKQHLSGSPLELPLPAARPRPTVPRYAGRSIPFSLSEGLCREVRALGSQLTATPFVVYLTALQLLLHRYTDEADIPVGIAVSGRLRVELENLVGFFINMLVIRADLSGNPTVEEAIARVRGVVLGGLEHQHLPFEVLVEKLNPERHRARTPLFQVALTYYSDSRSALRLPGAEVIPESVGGGKAKFDWTVSVGQTKTGARCSFGYDLDLYSDGVMQRAVGHWINVLSGMCGNPGRRISDLRLLPPEERRRVISIYNQTSRPYPRRCIHALVEERARETPGAVAVESGPETLTYQDLERQANAVAWRLRRAGVGPGQLVAVYAERTAGMIASLLGVLKLGAAYLPLDLNAPPERNRFMVRDAQAAAVLAQAGLEGDLGEVDAPVLIQGGGSVSDEAEAGASVAEPVSPDSRAYVMFTSGSTGQPKGVEVPHRAVVRLLFDNGYARFGAGTVFLHMAPLAFDASTLEIWAPLVHGGRCVLLRDRLPSPEAIGAAIRRHGVNSMWVTAALFNMIVDQDPTVFRPLKLLMTGGETVSGRHIREALRQLPETRIINGYGPTENTTFTTCYEIPRELSSDEPVPIGKPIGNTRVYVLDRYGAPVPEGVTGEIHAGGDGLALGYLNRPELTAERFIANPLPDAPDRTLYRTGDFGRWRDDGGLDFVGRKDGQVKVRGFRIELEEIEAALESHPWVRQAVASVWEPQPGGKSIAAWVVTDSERDGISQELREFLRSRLPDYMIPAVISRIGAIPLNPNGKADRQALPAPEIAAAAEPVAPADELEQRLAIIWRELLRREQINVTDNFLDLGGDSLQAVRVAARIESELGVKVEMAWFFATPTIRSLAAAIRGGLTSPEAAVMPIKPAGTRPPLYWVDPGVRMRALLDLLGGDQPWLGLRVPEEWWRSPDSSVENLGQYHCEALCRQRPGGPFALAAWCAAGLVAYETARHLRQAGAAVDALILFDTPLPRARAGSLIVRAARALWRISVKARVHLGYLMFECKGRRLEYVLDYVAKQLKWRHVTARLSETTIEEPEGDPDATFHRRMAKMLRAARSYEPRESDFPIFLIVPQWTGTERLRGPDLGWGAVARGAIRLFRTPGNHETMFDEPNVRRLAAILREILDGLHAPTGPG